jgi:hypothetical protein
MGDCHCLIAADLVCLTFARKSSLMSVDVRAVEELLFSSSMSSFCFDLWNLMLSSRHQQSHLAAEICSQLVRNGKRAVDVTVVCLEDGASSQDFVTIFLGYVQCFFWLLLFKG